MDKYRITVSMPCLGRPLRTMRAILAILAQDTNGWEALITGDHCPDFQRLIDSGWLPSKAEQAAANGNSLIYSNLPDRMGACGYHITNENIKNAKGKYLIFYANDDLILPNHFSNYLEIEDTYNDYMYFDSYIAPLKETRHSVLAPSRIGHSEIIVKADLARKTTPHEPTYGHDWKFISEIAEMGRGRKSSNGIITYHVMHIPNGGTVDKID